MVSLTRRQTSAPCRLPSRNAAIGTAPHPDPLPVRRGEGDVSLTATRLTEQARARNGGKQFPLPIRWGEVRVRGRGDCMDTAKPAPHRYPIRARCPPASRPKIRCNGTRCRPRKRPLWKQHARGSTERAFLAPDSNDFHQKGVFFQPTGANKALFEENLRFLRVSRRRIGDSARFRGDLESLRVALSRFLDLEGLRVVLKRFLDVSKPPRVVSR